MICWFPLYTINCLQAFCGNCNVPPVIMDFTIILSHANSAINPLLYAYHMKDFRLALKHLLLHRIWRRPTNGEYFYNRSFYSLVSPHHSTLYRVTQSTYISNLHTPHNQNTPASGSTQTLGRPNASGLRPRAFTLDGRPKKSEFHSFQCIPAETPEDLSLQPVSRPRAATITTHTAPASHQLGRDVSFDKSDIGDDNGNKNHEHRSTYLTKSESTTTTLTVDSVTPSACKADYNILENFDKKIVGVNLRKESSSYLKPPDPYRLSVRHSFISERQLPTTIEVSDGQIKDYENEKDINNAVKKLKSHKQKIQFETSSSDSETTLPGTQLTKKCQSQPSLSNTKQK
ncbi:unnamed protein product, partial [Meganyctiphanes norvegica]